jgi:hypothetical protein
MRTCLLLLAAVCLAFAPAPFRRPTPNSRPAEQMLAGTWDADWPGAGARIYLRPDGSARFEYTHNTSFWNGSWKCDVPSRLTLTLLQDGDATHFHMTFDSVGPDAAEGKVRVGTSWERAVKLTRSARK